MTATTFNVQNLRGQSLLFRCLETGFVTTAPALTRYQQGREPQGAGGRAAGAMVQEPPSDDLRALRPGDQGQPVDRPPTPAEQALCKSQDAAAGLMDHPIWLVFAGGVGFKAWKLIRLIHRQVRSSPWGLKRFRAALEQNWQRSVSVVEPTD